MPETEFYRRIGRFLLVLGIGLIGLFGFSDVAQEPRYNLFFWGLVAAVVGLIMIQRNKPEQVDSGRFRILKNFRKKKEK